jgi:hypothetical protein
LKQELAFVNVAAHFSVWGYRCRPRPAVTPASIRAAGRPWLLYSPERRYRAHLSAKQTPADVTYSTLTWAVSSENLNWGHAKVPRRANSASLSRVLAKALKEMNSASLNPNHAKVPRRMSRSTYLVDPPPRAVTWTETPAELAWSSRKMGKKSLHWMAVLQVAPHLVALADFVVGSENAQPHLNDRASVPEDHNVNKESYLHPIHCHNVGTS